MTPPEDCRTMAEVRAGVDALDERIVTLLAERFRYMDAAARIKPERSQVRDEARKAAVIAHAREIAARSALSPNVVAVIYEQLVEASIAYELACWDTR